jgi:hypothetical protein
VIVKKLQKVIFGTVLVASSVLMLAGISSAGSNGAPSIVNSTEYNDSEGHKFVALGIQQNNAPTNSISGSEALDQQQVDAAQISNWLDADKIGNGGIYVENGKIVVQLNDTSPAVVTKLKTLVKSPDKVSVNYVKYSEKEMKSLLTSLNKFPEVTASAINTKQNKVDVYISENSYKKNKSKIVTAVPEESINWIFGEFKVVEAAASNPGTTISDGTHICTAGFNAVTGTKNVMLSADHCGLGSYWYAGTTTTSANLLGQMTYGFMGSGYKEDAGYIELGTGTTIGVKLNGLTTTIGTFDYNGVRNSTVGYNMSFNFRSGNYNTTVANGSASISGGETDMVFTNPTGSVLGDSGGLVWSSITSSRNGGTYAVIEGVYKGYLLNTTTNTKIYDIYSKFANIYTDLGLTGVYTDTSY